LIAVLASCERLDMADALTTDEEVRSWLATALPDGTVSSVRRLGEGQDHRVWLVDDAIVVRVAKTAARAERLRHEEAVLALVARVSPLPTPRVVLAAADEGVLVCTFLAGTSLLDSELAPGPEVAKQLGALLRSLHAVASATVPWASVDAPRLVDWLSEACAEWSVLRETVPRAWVPAVDAFLSSSSPPPPDPARYVLCHNDLGSEHLLLGHDGLLSGVIDWGDAALADPAVDFARIRRDFGPELTRSVLAEYALPVDDGFWERIELYARCSLIEDLAFAHETNDDRYRRASLRSMRHLFGAAR
jgi:aminoglycoside phosphotransferase (APT) family kinase protein